MVSFTGQSPAWPTWIPAALETFAYANTGVGRNIAVPTRQLQPLTGKTKSVTVIMYIILNYSFLS